MGAAERSAASRQLLPRNARLHRREDFDRVFADNLRSSDERLTVLARPNGLERPRLGIAASRKVLGGAVARNRFKRLVREQFRLMQHDLVPLDIVVLARAGAVGATPADLRASLQRLLKNVSARCRH